MANAFDEKRIKHGWMRFENMYTDERRYSKTEIFDPIFSLYFSLLDIKIWYETYIWYYIFKYNSLE